MNARTQTITYTDSRGRITMKSFSDHRKEREDRAICGVCAAVLFCLFIVAIARWV